VELVNDIEEIQSRVIKLKSKIKEEEEAIVAKINDVWGVKEEENLSMAAEPKNGYGK